MRFEHLRKLPLFLIMLFVAAILLFVGIRLTRRVEEKGAEEVAPSPLYGGTYRKGLEGDPALLDPARMTDIFEVAVTQQIFEGLVQYSDNLMVVPCIAEYWESSRDNLHWTFYIKRGVLFHNGREVTADDFVYAFTRILDSKTGSGAASLLSKIEGASAFREGKAGHVEGLKALDRSTLDIRLSESFSQFVAVLAMVNFGVVPKEEVERLGDDFGHYPVGTGPFRFERWDRNREIVLRANEHYHEGRPYLDEAIFRIFPGGSREQMFSEFEEGNLEDSLFPEENREKVLNNPNYLILRRPSLSIRLIIMNNKVEPFINKKVRQAFNYAVDKEELSIEIGKGRFTAANSLIPPGMAGYRPESVNYPYSPEKARELLKEAGYPDGQGLPVIQFWSATKSKTYVEEDEAIGRYLSAIGVKVEFHYETDWPIFKDMMAKGQLPMFRYGWSADVPDPDNIIYSLFHSSSPTNRSFYRNPKIDALIEKAQEERSYEKRISLYSSIQEMIMEDAPIILQSYRIYERVFQPYVRNFKGKALGDHYFSLKQIWLDREGVAQP